MGEQKVQNGQEQDLGQLLKVRRDKLAELQAKGQDPFRLTKYDVTHHSQEIKDENYVYKNRLFDAKLQYQNDLQAVKDRRQFIVLAFYRVVDG